MPRKFFGAGVAGAMHGLSRVVPNLRLYVPSRALLLGEVPGQAVWGYVGSATLYAVAYVTGLLVLSAVIFRRRDFLSDGRSAPAPWRPSASSGIVAPRCHRECELSLGQVHAAAADVAGSKGDWPEAIAQSSRPLPATPSRAAPGPSAGWVRLEATRTRRRGPRRRRHGAPRIQRDARGGAGDAGGPARAGQPRRDQAESGSARGRREARASGPRTPADSLLVALRVDETPAPGVVLALSATPAVAMVSGLARLAWLGDGAGRARVAQAIAAAGVLGYVAVALTR